MERDGSTPMPRPTARTVEPDAPTALVGLATDRPALRWGWALVAVGVLLFLVSVGGWWAQDAIGTVLNEGEADVGESITFTSDGGSYRLLSSGPLRPLPGSTYCDLTYADESTRREVGGQGLQTSRLGVDRLLTFEPPPGRTQVRCTDRGSATTGNGRFQVLEADGVLSKALIGAIVAALASLAVGIAVVVRSFRRGSGPASSIPGISGAAGWTGAFDPGGFADPAEEHDPRPDPD